jgi:hypothetical protein
MQTTLRLPDDLYEQVKRRAAAEGTTVTAFLESALRMRLSLDQAREEQGPYLVTPLPGRGGTLPGVDLDSNEALLDLMEDR